MAAGLVTHNLTTATGVTFTVNCWVPDTTAPDVGAIPVSIPVSSAGVPIQAGTGTASTALRTTLATDVGLPAGAAALGKVKITNDAGTVVDPVAVGTAAMAASVPVTIATNDTVLGGNADAASLTTSIKAALRGIGTALGITALDLGSGTGGSRTLRWILDTAQWVGGTGTDSSAVQRVTLATNVALPTPGTAAASLGKAEDAEHASGDVGVMALSRKLAFPASSSATDGDYVTLNSDANGNLYVAARPGGTEYEAVAASQNSPGQTIGATGAAGDYLSHVIVSPAVAGCGIVTILDNATEIAAFVGGGTTALSNLIPFVIPIGVTSTSGAWKITTGANVKCVAVGKFT